MVSSFRPVIHQASSGSLVLTRERLSFHSDVHGSEGAVELLWSEVTKITANATNSPTSSKLRVTFADHRGGNGKHFFKFASRAELERAKTQMDVFLQAYQQDCISKQSGVVDCEMDRCNEDPSEGCDTATTSDITGIHDLSLAHSKRKATSEGISSQTFVSRSQNTLPTRASTGALARKVPKEVLSESQKHGTRTTSDSTATICESEWLSSQTLPSRSQDSLPRRASTSALDREVPKEVHVSKSRKHSGTKSTLDAAPTVSIKSSECLSSKAFSSRHQGSLPRRASTGALERRRHSGSTKSTLEAAPPMRSSSATPTQHDHNQDTVHTPVIQVYPHDCVIVSGDHEPFHMDSVVRATQNMQAAPLTQGRLTRTEAISLANPERIGAGAYNYNETLDIEGGRNGRGPNHHGTKAYNYNETLDVEAGPNHHGTKAYNYNETLDLEAGGKDQASKHPDSFVESKEFRIGCITLSVCCCLLILGVIIFLIVFFTTQDDDDGNRAARADFYSYTFEDGAFWVRK